MKDGKGVLTTSNGAVYTGKFYQDKKHGKGEMKGPDKQVFLEQWKFGVLINRKLIAKANQDDNSQNHSQNMSKGNSSMLFDPMRPGNTPAELLDQTQLSNTFHLTDQSQQLDKTVVANDVT